MGNEIKIDSLVIIKSQIANENTKGKIFRVKEIVGDLAKIEFEEGQDRYYFKEMLILI